MTSVDQEPLRVGYVMTHYPRLAQTFIAGEIDSVVAAGVEVTPFAMNRPDAGERARPGAAAREAATLYLKDRPLDALGAALALAVRHPIGMARITKDAIRSAGGQPLRTARRLAQLAQAARVARAARARGIRHLHAHFGLAPATIAWLASRMAALDGPRTGFSFTIHGYHDFIDPAETRLDIKAKAADAVVCISDFTRSQLYLVSDPSLWKRFSVLRCGVDLARWPFRPPDAREGAPVIVAIGRLSAEKGFSVLIDAMARLRDAQVPATLRLVGDGPERARLTAQIEALDLADRVRLDGELTPDEVRDALTEAQVFCLPSFSEGLPVSIMEAMAAGVPVVTSWIAGIPELAQSEVTALTVPPGRADALADALQRLLTDQALAARLAIAARRRVEELHDQRKNGAAMADLLRGLAA
jgi:colanic acid/amylovoran biosynthesis glycosyltransferase